MARVRTRDTDIELVLRRALWSRGVRYRLHPPLPGTPDLAIPSARLAIFVDACFWHGCPQHYTAPRANAAYWEEKVARNRARDARVDIELRAQEWEVIRVWEHELTADLESVVERVLNRLAMSKAARRSPPPSSTQGQQAGSNSREGTS
jgi:DNA mismatch endonuclease (patch repair protein)